MHFCSRLLIGESGCAEVRTPPALDRHCPFSTMHFLTCLYKAGPHQSAVRCAVLLYGSELTQLQWNRRSSVEEQSELLSENLPDVLTIYDLQG